MNYQIIAEKNEPGEVHHYRATEAYILRSIADGECVGVWTDAEYLTQFGKEYKPEGVVDYVSFLPSQEPSPNCPTTPINSPFDDTIDECGYTAYDKEVPYL